MNVYDESKVIDVSGGVTEISIVVSGAVTKFISVTHVVSQLDATGSKSNSSTAVYDSAASPQINNISSKEDVVDTSGCAGDDGKAN